MRLACAVLGLSLAACHHHELGSGPQVVERDYARPAGLVWSAGVESAKDAGLHVRSACYESHAGTLEAAEARITVVPLHESRSRVSIRVGPDQLALARALHERIAGNLSSRGGAP